MLEKIDGDPMSGRRKVQRQRWIAAGALTFLLLSAVGWGPGLRAQNQAGGSFLKLIPGARQQGIQGSLTGAVDNMYAIFANPGAAGMLREWQLSFSYTRWIPDIYHATLFWAGRVATPWSRHARLGLTLAYLGVPDFDSTNGRLPAESAGDLLVMATFGQPLPVLHRNLSIGVNAKYLRSKLSSVSDGTVAFDAGLLWRSPGLSLASSRSALLQHLVFSAGIAVTQMGPGLEFETTTTPLPRTLRMGASLNAGTHNGLQVHIAADYRNVRDENDYFTLGAEISVAQVLTLRGGYNFEEDNLLQHVAVGLSFGLSDVRPPGSSIPALKNRALRLDLAAIEGNDFFRAPYRGSASHFPIGPEFFRFIRPQRGDTLASAAVSLRWEAARDPDLYDEVTYWLLVDPSQQAVAGFLNQIAKMDRSEFREFLASGSQPFLVSRQVRSPNFELAIRECGTYSWTVIAYDRDHHFRVIGGRDEHIASFTLSRPALRITGIEVQRPEASGGRSRVLTFTLMNEGSDAGTVTLLLSELRRANFAATPPQPGDSLYRSLLAEMPVSGLTAGSQRQMEFELPDGLRGEQLEISLAEKDLRRSCRDNGALATVDLPPAGADVKITKSADRTTVFPGDTVRYVLRVENLGPAPAHEIAVVDSLPGFVRVLQADPSARVSADGRILRWHTEHLPKGEQQALTLRYSAVIGPIPFPRKRWFKLDSVNFHFSSADLNDAARSALDEILPHLVLYVQRNPAAKIEIGGHTDSVGSLAFNERLSQQRAESVRAYLLEKRPQLAGNLSARGYGETRPLLANLDENCRRRNRRVEINLLSDEITAGDFPLENRAHVSARDDFNPQNDIAQHHIRALPRPEPEQKILKGVTFEFDQAVLTAAARRVLDAMAEQIVEMMADDPTLCIEIEGHTDSRGSDSYNQSLSQRRAQSVVNYLKSKCILPNRIFARGYGESRPIDDNSTEAGRARNRRVVLTPHPNSGGDCASLTRL